MQPAAGVLAAPVLEELAADLCRAQGPSQALLAAAAALCQQTPSLVFVGLAVAAQDRQSVRYSTLHQTRQGAARLGAVANPSCAAGIAIDTKRVVHVRDLSQGDLGFHDLQYLQQEHGARACIVMPLVVAQSALGALSLAAAQMDAFNGQEPWLQVVAALCAPYVLLLRSHEQLLALEGLVSQMLPMRVALQLHDQHCRSMSVQLPQGASEQQQLPLRPSSGMTDGDPGSSAAAEAAAAAAGHVGGRTLRAGVDQVSAAEDAAESGFRQANHSLRQLRAAQRLQQQGRQLQQQQQEQVPSASAPQPRPQPAEGAAGQQAPAQQHRGQVHQQQLQCGDWFWQPFKQLTFQQQRLEQAYQQWALQQWLRLLDCVFAALVLLSTFGGTLRHLLVSLYGLLQQQGQPISSSLSEAAAGLLLLAAAIGTPYLMQRQPTGSYLRWRSRGVITLRLLRTVLFCLEVLHLNPALGLTVQQGPNVGGLGRVLQGGVFATRAGSAACGLLMMLGLLGQLPSGAHAAVQAVCFVMVSITLLFLQQPGLSRPKTPGGMTQLPGFTGMAVSGGPAAAVLVVMGWLLPVAAVTAAEWATRRHFLHKIS